MRLYNMTDAPGMREMLAFMIARDTMHQQRWLVVIEELGGNETQLPIPNSFPQDREDQRYSYALFIHDRNQEFPEGRRTQGPADDLRAARRRALSRPGAIRGRCAAWADERGPGDGQPDVLRPGQDRAARQRPRRRTALMDGVTPVLSGRHA